MMEVTKDQFFATVGQLNVHPRSERDYSTWEMVNTRETIGRTEPGYMCRDKDGRYTTEKRYWVADRFAAAKATQ